MSRTGQPVALPAVTVWPRRRRRNCWLLLALVGLVVVSPLESGLLPGRLGDMLETPRAEAQNPPYQLGDPDPCPQLHFVGLPAFAEDRSLIMYGDPGTDADYPTLWQVSDDGSECILELPACPISPISLRLMWPSVASDRTAMAFTHLDPRVPPDGYGLWTDTYTNLRLARYPEFCEDRVDNTNTPVFEHCRDNVSGHVVTLYVSGCRVLTPLACPDAGVVGVGMNRGGAQSCRAVQRRTWTCPSGYEQANAFNSCYLRASSPADPGAHPACGLGAPEFPLGPSAEFLRRYPNTSANSSQLACAEYVGEDFTDQRSCQQMSDPNDFLINFGLVGGNDYWCSYEVWLLRIECHDLGNRPPDCLAAGEALCIKRASRTGGCDQVAQTIVCRVLEWAFRQGNATLQDVRASGCDPCPTLPFDSSGIPPHCPTPTSDREPSEKMKRILRVRGDLDYTYSGCNGVDDHEAFLANSACRSRPACADPPRGRIEWESGHGSGRAVVNSPVTVSVVDVLVRRVQEGTLTFQLRSPSHPFTGRLNHLHYEDTVGENVPAPRLRNFAISPADGTGRYSSVADMLSEEWSRRAYECTARDDPVFNILVQELWPDQMTDQDEIRRLFGADALQWWDDLTFAKRRDITEARSITWHRPLDDAQSMARCIPPSQVPPCTTWDVSLTPQQSMDRSSALLTSEVECRMDTYRTCIWNPPRPGYFKLTGAGAWRVTRSRVRNWIADGSVLNNVSSSAAQFLSANVQDVRRWVRNTGKPPEDFGLQDDGATVKVRETGLDPNCLIQPYCWSDRDWLFTEEATRTTACGPIDNRVACGGGESGSYTETEPVGVLVHEVQVRTVMPSR